MPSDWSEDDIRQADEAVAAVEAEGWHQGAAEARNFVRLKGDDDQTTFIALIDFEDAFQ